MRHDDTSGDMQYRWVHRVPGTRHLQWKNAGEESVRHLGAMNLCLWISCCPDGVHYQTFVSQASALQTRLPENICVVSTTQPEPIPKHNTCTQVCPLASLEEKSPIRSLIVIMKLSRYLLSMMASAAALAFMPVVASAESTLYPNLYARDAYTCYGVSCHVFLNPFAIFSVVAPFTLGDARLLGSLTSTRCTLTCLNAPITHLAKI